jgi:hypothetical protein
MDHSEYDSRLVLLLVDDFSHLAVCYPVEETDRPRRLLLFPTQTVRLSNSQSFLVILSSAFALLVSFQSNDLCDAIVPSNSCYGEVYKTNGCGGRHDGLCVFNGAKISS